MIVDTHAHMNSPDFKKDFDEVMARAAKEKVGAVVNRPFPGRDDRRHICPVRAQSTGSRASVFTSSMTT